MPIQPIDLQVLFSHLNQVGRDQAVQKGIFELQQAVHGNEIAEKNIQRDHSVNEPDQITDGLEKAKEKEQEKKEKGRGREEREKSSGVPSPPKEVFKDPDLGHHIDITG